MSNITTESLIQAQSAHSLLENETAPPEEQVDLDPSHVPPSHSSLNIRPRIARDPASFWQTGSGDIALALGATYFIVLNLVSLSKHGKTVDEVIWLPRLVTAASYGPTIFPILFSAALGRFLTQLAYYRLERGTSVQSMEQLQGSQTVISTLVTQFTLRAWNPHFVLIAAVLLSTWSLSPLGSQAALRFVSLIDTDQTATYYVAYLNNTAGQYNPRASDYSISLADFLFGVSLMLPETSKSEPQDLYGNLRIPMVEQLEGSSSLAWIEVTGEKVEHSSLIGIPIYLYGSDAARLAFSFNTSYWWLDCHIDMATSPIKWPNKQVHDPADAFYMTWDPGHPSRTDDTPRKLNIGAPNLIHSNTTFVGTCSLTNTFVTVNATCQQSSPTQRSCAVAAIRRTSHDALEMSRTQLDTIGYGRDNVFLEQLRVSTVTNDISWNSEATPAVFGYLLDPENPFKFNGETPDWSNLTDQSLSTRVSQIFNTYWLASTAYQPIRGMYTTGAGQNGRVGSGAYQMNLTSATGWNPKATLACNAGWSATLMLAALVVLAAAISSLVMGSRRRCPGFLNNFSALLRDNPYTIMMTTDAANSMSDGPELAKAWRFERVCIGHVIADECEGGYVAIGTPSTVSVTPLGLKQRQA